MRISKLIEILERLQEMHGDLDVLVQARNSGEEYNEYLPIHKVDFCGEIYDCLDTYYNKVAVI